MPRTSITTPLRASGLRESSMSKKRCPSLRVPETTPQPGQFKHPGNPRQGFAEADSPRRPSDPG